MTSTLFSIATISEGKEPSIHAVEINPGKCLYVNSGLEVEQLEQMMQMIKRQCGAFAWDYSYMEGICSNTCMHHIYTNEEIRLVRQPQRRMNPTLKDIVIQLAHKIEEDIDQRLQNKLVRGGNLLYIT